MSVKREEIRLDFQQTYIKSISDLLKLKKLNLEMKPDNTDLNVCMEQYTNCHHDTANSQNTY